MKFEAHMTTDGKLQYLRENIPVADLFGQLAEECTELAQAALKMQRHLREVNPPRKCLDEIMADIAEERNDVMICLELVHFGADKGSTVYWDAVDEKLDRWVRCIKAVKVDRSELEAARAERDALEARLRHLLESPVVREYDEVDRNGLYVRDINDLGASASCCCAHGCPGI